MKKRPTNLDQRFPLPVFHHRPPPGWTNFRRFQLPADLRLPLRARPAEPRRQIQLLPPPPTLSPRLLRGTPDLPVDRGLEVALEKKTIFFKFPSVHIKLVSPPAAQLEIFFHLLFSRD